jgi:hypothetical protein
MDDEPKRTWHQETLVIRPASVKDAVAIAAIYNHYILNSVITFEEEVVSTADMAGRIVEVESDMLPWLVGERTGGWIPAMRRSVWAAQGRRTARRHRRDRAAQSRERRTTREVRNDPYRALQRGRLQVRPVDRRGLLADGALTIKRGPRGVRPDRHRRIKRGPQSMLWPRPVGLTENAGFRPRRSARRDVRPRCPAPSR